MKYLREKVKQNKDIEKDGVGGLLSCRFMEVLSERLTFEQCLGLRQMQELTSTWIVKKRFVSPGQMAHLFIFRISMCIRKLKRKKSHTFGQLM